MKTYLVTNLHHFATFPKNLDIKKMTAFANHDAISTPYVRRWMYSLPSGFVCYNFGTLGLMDVQKQNGLNECGTHVPHNIII